MRAIVPLILICQNDELGTKTDLSAIFLKSSSKISDLRGGFKEETFQTHRLLEVEWSVLLRAICISMAFVVSAISSRCASNYRTPTL